jgi:hypothetical protein
MRLHIIAVVLAPFVPIIHTIHAHPLNSSLSLIPRTGKPGRAYLCNKPAWAGNCKSYDFKVGCQAIQDADKPVRSFGPDIGGSCKLYHTKDCTGDVYARPDQEPGDDPNVWKYFGSYTPVSANILSFKCILCTNTRCKVGVN